MQVIESRELYIQWDPGTHVSRFDAQWLRDHCYSGTSRAARRHQPTWWDSELQTRLPKLFYDRCIDDERGLFELLKYLRDHGFAVIAGVPTNEQAFLDVVARIGYVKETNYGRLCHLQAAARAKTANETTREIPLHTDENFRHANAGVVAFLCLSSSADGEGASLLADGFAIASHLRESDPESFDFLTRVPMVSRRFHPGEMDLRSQRPVISVDFEGRLQGVGYAERSAMPLDLPEEMIEPAYRALGGWLRLTRDERFSVKFLLQPGDLLVFDNQRVLHGREEFGGARHMLYCQLDLDEPHSRLRVLADRLGVPRQDLLTHRGG